MKTMQKLSGLAFTLMLLSGTVHAAGLGKLSIQSALGQPLRAEIELLSVNRDDLPAISAKLANSEAFRQAHIDRVEALGNLRLTVDQRSNGQPIVRITSTSAVNDPFLDLLIELNWNSGRILREYTLLLDPPTDVKQAAEPVTVPVATTGATPPVETSQPAAGTAPVKPEPTRVEPARPHRYGPVKAGETLRSISGQLKPAGLTVEQMMVALYQGNKSAFFADNMNNLKKGKVLNVPGADSVAAVDRSSALHVMREQAAVWHAYRSKVAEEAPEAPAAKTAGQPSTGKITAKPAEKPAPAPTTAKDVLKLSKGEPAATAKPDARLQEKQRAFEEELAAKDRALKEALSRVTQLEKTVSDLQKLMELRGKTPAPATAPQPAPQPAPPTVKPPTPVVQVPPPAPAPQPSAAPEVQPKPVVEAPKPAPVTKIAPPVPEPAQAPTGSWWSTFITDPLYIGGLIAAGLLSALLWMMMVGSRRKQNLNKFEDSIMTGGEFKNASVFNAPTKTGHGATTGGSMLLTDFSRLGLGAIDTHEVDPIAEAEVYMAYGRDAQAEEILKEALVKDPGRHEIALKLLEIYAARKDTVAFETAASELYAGLGGQNTPVWQRAAEMGRSIDASNPLYRLVPGEPGVQPIVPTGTPMQTMPERAPAEQKPASKTEPAVISMPSSSIDFRESPAARATTEAAKKIEAVLPALEPVSMPESLARIEPMHLAGGDTGDVVSAPQVHLAEPVPTIEPAPVMRLEMPAVHDVDELETELELPPVAGQSQNDLDFSDIDLDLKAVPAIPEPVPAPHPDDTVVMTPAAAPGVDSAHEVAAPVDFSDEPFNLWEEVNTKLDLARAYLEMGDKEGAREILQEVAGEGDANQKDEAKKLLSEAG